MIMVNYTYIDTMNMKLYRLDTLNIGVMQNLTKNDTYWKQGQMYDELMEAKLKALDGDVFYDTGFALANSKSLNV